MEAEDFSVWLSGIGRLSADQRREAFAALACGFRRSRPCIPIGSRPPIPIRSRPGFRFEADHPTFASADRGDDVSAGRIGQACRIFWLLGEARSGWVAVGKAGVARPP